MSHDILDTASEAYYKGEPILSDEEFDAISDNYDEIGHKVSGRPHMYPMWSLQKAYDEENPLKGYKGVITKSPKLDGAAISVEYCGGGYSLALTRGNGKEGIVIGDKVERLVPPYIWLEEDYQIVGEVVAPIHIENSRNYAAGALNLKNVEEFSTREVAFVAYGIKPTISNNWYADMKLLQSWGFRTVIDENLDCFPTDGVVYRIDDYKDFDSAGYTSKFPRGAYAKKERPKGVVTTLLGVEWNLGRSGVVAPVAILEPVLVGDAIISKSTLHNMAYIKALNLEIGCKVEVIRSGEIIPRIVKRIYD